MTEYRELWVMLTDNTFDLNNEVIKFLKCSICDKLLIDAYMGECGCKYCWKCINNYLNGESKKCPGNRGKCKFLKTNINVNIMNDNETNLTISKLKVNCPAVGCRYNSNLLQLVKHMKLCKVKLLLCPFSEMGCPAVLMKESDLTAHLLEQMPSHNQAMNIWAMNIKNDILVNSMVKKQEIVDLCSKKLQNAIDAKLSQALFNNSSIKGKSFEEYEVTLRDLKKQQEELSNLFVEVSEYSNRTIDQLKSKNSEQADLIEQLKAANVVLTKEIDDIHNKYRKSTNNVEGSQPQNTFSKEVWMGESDTEPRKHFASLIWSIINFIQLKDEGCSFYSVLFPSSCRNYAMRLHVSMGGCDQHSEAYLCIEISCYLNISLMTSVEMPRARITITIKHRQNYKSFVSESKTIPKTSTKSHKRFHFKYADLEKKSVSENGEILIECVVDLVK